MNSKFDKVNHDSIQKYSDNPKDVPLSRRIFSACMGSVITSVIVTPLDVVKIRLQIGDPNIYSQSCCESSKLINGLSAYSKCLGLRKDQFGKLRCDQLVYSSKFFDHVEPLAIPKNSVSIPLSNIYYHLSPTFSKTSFSTIATVLDRNSVLSGLRQIIHQDGATGLWRGLVPTLLMALPATVVYFVGYEILRNHELWKQYSNPDEMINQLAPMICGASSRALAVCVISPLELLRTRIQSVSVIGNRFTLWKDLKKMIKTNGAVSLWKGLIPTLWRDVPFSAIYWWGYEKSKEYLQSRIFLNNDNSIIPFISGCISGAFAATLTTPLDVAKTRRQVQGIELEALSATNENVFNTKERSIHRILLSVWNEAGWKGLFRGKLI